MREIQLRAVKAQFSAIVDEAVAGTPTLVTKFRKPMAVIIGYKQWQALQGERPSFVDLLLAFPGNIPVEDDSAPASPEHP